MTTHTATSSAPAKAGSTSNKTMARNREERKDPYALVTDALVSAMERGVQPWRKRWEKGQGGGLPLRYSGETYRGVNVLILWMAAQAQMYTSAFWMTYRQALELGGQVRRGETATTVVYYGNGVSEDRNPEKQSGAGESGKVYRFLKTFSVFNADQIEGLPAKFSYAAPQVMPATQRIEEIERLISATGATIRHGGNAAYYSPSNDAIQMPDFTVFHSTELYYATLMHELGHWTRAKHRLDRNFGSTARGDAGYAQEELVAELTAAFLGSELGFAPDHLEDHATYLSYWLEQIKADKRLIFTLAAKAQAAADYILQRSPASAQGGGAR